MGCFLVTYGMTSSSAYYYTKAMSQLFLHTPSDTGVSFQAISNMEDFWEVSMRFLPLLLFINGLKPQTRAMATSKGQVELMG